MCEYCEQGKPLRENLDCKFAGTIRFIRVARQKFGHYLSISTWGKYGKKQKYTKINFCPMCGRKLEENK